MTAALPMSLQITRPYRHAHLGGGVGPFGGASGHRDNARHTLTHLEEPGHKSCLEITRLHFFPFFPRKGDEMFSILLFFVWLDISFLKK